MTCLRSITAEPEMRRPLAILAAIAMAAPVNMASAAESGDHSARSSTVRAVRAATREFRNVNAATAAGYISSGSCASGPNEGAMGIHYVNEAYLADGYIDVNRPEILVYEPRNGGLQLVAVEYFVGAEQWDAANEGPPVLEGHLFHYLGAPIGCGRLRIISCTFGLGNRIQKAPSPIGIPRCHARSTREAMRRATCQSIEHSVNGTPR